MTEYMDFTGYPSAREVPMEPVEKMVPAGSDDEIVNWHGRRCYVKQVACPACNKDLSANIGCNYCPECGQRIEWEEA